MKNNKLITIRDIFYIFTNKFNSRLTAQG
ncbi:MAG: hypothetical protein IPN20_20865 [Haliscomenobacter sp.]|nr:hypothetical protein [Haliscomenobacter sp.]MBK8656304.1 hypothetical protein [Haliscomenobacter sp.]